MADFQLRRTERLHVEWPVRQPLTLKTARLLDRHGQPLGPPLTVTDGSGPTAAAVVDLGLSAFAEGDYLLELTAESGTDRERRLLAFRVVR